ncbi:MAG: GGDEF domain-containing protein [Bacillota bacterium]|nr:MAG: GGDEF domain-containing protein [Bacillota bacterium]
MGGRDRGEGYPLGSQRRPPGYPSSLSCFLLYSHAIPGVLLYDDWCKASPTIRNARVAVIVVVRSCHLFRPGLDADNPGRRCGGFMTLNTFLEGLITLTVSAWFVMAVTLFFRLKRDRVVWLVLLAGLAAVLVATLIDLIGDLTGQPGVLFLPKNVLYAVGGILFSAGIAAWCRVTIAYAEKSERLATTDELTGVLNRRGLMAFAERELAQAARGGEKLAILVVDIDNLKSVNDRHGHLAGDRILAAVGRALRDELGPRSTIGRFGGDEFLIFVRLTPEEPDRLVRLAERLNEALSELAPTLEVPAGMSMGAAVFPEDGSTLEVLFETADKRMYREKTLRGGSDG